MPSKLYHIVRSSLLACLLSAFGSILTITGQTSLQTGGINSYARVTSVGTTHVVADNVTGFAAGDTVMIMQMSGVSINVASGVRGNYQNKIGEPGSYEITIIESVNSATGRVNLTRTMLNEYRAEGKVQLVKVRSYSDAVVNSELTCQMWDSSLVRGGVLVFLVKGVLTLNDDINVAGKGFKGGIVSQGSGYCQVSHDSIRQYFYSIWSAASGYKGEGLAIKSTLDQPIYPGLAKGRAPNMTGGGGGNGHFSGGGGGSNYGSGSPGDVEINDGLCLGLNPGGIEGFNVAAVAALSSGVYLGGGGGVSTWLTSPSASAGGNGGGIVIILADTIVGNGKIITADGAGARANTVTGSGAGGGGAGGSVIISTSHYSSLPRLSAQGGNGGNNNRHINGAGGGGGGGLIWTSGSFAGTVSVAGGQGGQHTGGTTNLNGTAGLVRANLNLPLNGFLFNEIHVVRTRNRTDSICEGMAPPELTGTRPAGGSGSYSYQWQKSYDNVNWTNVAGNSRDYTPATAESVTCWFRRVVSDGSGITDRSLPVQIIVHPRITDNLVGRDTTLCYGMRPELLYPLNAGPAGGTGLYFYHWEQSTDNTTWVGGSGGNSSAGYYPPSLNATTYYRRIVNSGACTDITPAVTVTILPEITGNTVAADQTICEGSRFANLTGSQPAGGASPNYIYQWMSSADNLSWSPAPAVNSNSGYDPQDDSPGTTFYRRMVYSGPDNTCSSVSNIVTLTSHPALSNNIIGSDQTICQESAPAALDGSLPTGGAGAGTYSYSWMISANGTSFSPITGATDASLPGTPLTADRWFRRSVTSSACSSESNVVQITVDPAITSYAIELPPDGHDTICTGTAPALLSGGTVGGSGSFTYSWSSSADNSSYTPLGSTAASYQSGTLTSTTWFRRTVTSGACSESSSVRITVLPLITANSVTADQRVCDSDTPAQLDGSLPAGGDGRYRYLWEKSSQTVTEWAPAPGVSNMLNYQPPRLDETTRFRRRVFSGEADCCISVSEPVTIAVDIMPRNVTAGADRALLPYQLAARLTGSFDGDGVPAWRYEYGSADARPEFSAPDEKVTEVRKLGFGDNRFLFTVTNGKCVAPVAGVTLTVPELTIPQGVTPNNDGINDYFNIEGLEFTHNELVIINSAGAVVYRANDYSSDDPAEAWNGLDMYGNEAPSGTYYYLLTIRGAQNLEVPDYTAYISGFIILRRE